MNLHLTFFFFSSRRRHTRYIGDWSSDVCSSDLVHVADNTNSPIANAPVTMSLNGTPPCSTAVLSGTLTQSTSPTGDVFFLDLNVDRGQIGYALRATVGSVSAVSSPFTVNGFCGTGNLNTA